MKPLVLKWDRERNQEQFCVKVFILTSTSIRSDRNKLFPFGNTDYSISFFQPEEGGCMGSHTVWLGGCMEPHCKVGGRGPCMKPHCMVWGWGPCIKAPLNGVPLSRTTDRHFWNDSDDRCAGLVDRLLPKLSMHVNAEAFCLYKLRLEQGGVCVLYQKALQKAFLYYHPRMRIANNFTWVCLCVCLFRL